MRESSNDAQLDGEVRSVTYGDTLEVSAWRAGKQLTDTIPVSGFTLNWDASRLNQGQGSFLFGDPDGVLWPRSIADALAPGGSRLHVVYVFGATGTRIDLGWWRIRECDPNTFFQWRKLGSELVWLPGGGTVTVDADEETASLEMDRLDIGSARTPVMGTVLGEVERLAADYLPLIVAAGVEDAPMPGGVEYEEDRLATIQGLLSRVNATFRVHPKPALEIIPASGVPVDWVIEPGEDGTLVSVGNTMSDADLANAVTSHVTLEDETTLIGRARLNAGPLAFGGPFGKVTVFRGANLATTQAQVNDDAATTLARLSAQGDVHLTLETLANPALQLGDRVQLVKPDNLGVTTLSGRVDAMTLTARNGVTSKSMRVRLSVNAKELLNAQATG